jgi:single-strand DNA-binding protein
MAVGETQITIIGNVTKDPEIRFGPSGTAVVRFSVAVNERKLNRESGKWEEGDTAFHNVTAFRQLAENVAESIGKGARVIVHGALKQERWEDPASKETRTGWKLIADAVGPDLAFATAKTSKTTTGNGAGQSDPSDPWATASRTRPAGTETGNYQVSAGTGEGKNRG